MLRASRIVYVLLAWAFLLGLLVQVFLIGLYLFSNPSALAEHRSFGWVLHLSPLLVLLFAALARAGRRHWLWALGLAVFVFITPILPGLRSSAPVVAALHPVFAVADVVLAAVVAWNSVQAWRLGDAPVATPIS